MGGREREVTHVAPLPGGRTEVLIVTYADGERWVFKPDRDAQHFEVERDGLLVDSGAELAAYLVSEGLGLGVVPETRPGRVGERSGVLQRFVEGSRNVAETVVTPRDAPRIPPAIVFLDHVIGNRDRRQANRLLDPGPPPRELAIDHGFAFIPRTDLDTFLRNVMVFDVPVEIPELPPLYESVLGVPIESWAARFATVISSERAEAMQRATVREIESVRESADVRAALSRPVPAALFDEAAALVGALRAREARERLERFRERQ